MRHKRAAQHQIGIDIDPAVVATWEKCRSLLANLHVLMQCSISMESWLTNKHHSLQLDPPLTPRNKLLEIGGTGYKTAGWVVRNILDSDDVAILDIHLIRAGRICRLYIAGARIVIGPSC